MNNNKKLSFIAGLLIMMGCMWLFIMYSDWSRLWQYGIEGKFLEHSISRQLKLVLSFLTFSVVLIQGKNALSRRDHRLLLSIFVFFFCAEIFFFLENASMGIAIFAIAQILLIIRNLSGLKEYVGNGSFRKKKVVWTVSGVLILTVNILIIVTIFMKYKENPLIPLITIYSQFLCLSVGAGIATNAIGFFSKKNSLLITFGIILFYLGDITVGLNLLFISSQKHVEYIITTSLTWLFYLPSITLLALSGFLWEKNKT